MSTLYDTMSITKAAIGSYYLFHQFDEDNKIEGLDTNVWEAANHVSKYSPLKKTLRGKVYGWDYDHFRTAVESNKDLLAYCVEQLEPCGTKKMNEDGTYPWEYNDLMYQILACMNPKAVVEHFAKMTRTTKISEVTEEKEDGKVFYYRYGVSFSHSTTYYNKLAVTTIDRGMYGWKWEHTKSGIPLGPHGLHMTKDTAEGFAMAAKSSESMLKLAPSYKVKIPRDEWRGIAPGRGDYVFTHYSYGWFFTEKCAYAIGYVCQVIAILPNGVVSQLYEEKWGEDNPNFMDHKNNRWKHPRWSFIRNIENFQRRVENLTLIYLYNKVKKPPKGQTGASIIMPSGTGKSYYIDRQNQNESIKDEFIDCDPLTWETNAQPHYVDDKVVNNCPWNWKDHLKLICLQVDQVVKIAKRRGFWIMGATWWDASQVNAIVLLPEAVHRYRLKNKSDPFPDTYYDDTIKGLIKQLEYDSKQQSIPIFRSLNGIELCVNYIREQFSTIFVRYRVQQGRPAPPFRHLKF